MKRVSCLLTLFVLLSSPAGAIACELARAQIVFPGQGTHIAWFCQASEAEKQRALALMRASTCIAQKLRAWGLPAVSAECNDVIPYYFTRPDAVKAGPVLDCRLTLSSTADAGYEQKSGYRALATSHGGSGTAFDIGGPTLFTKECPAGVCTERFTDLCEAPPQTAPY